MIDFVMIFALVLLVTGLSLPTLIQLSSLLKNDSTPSTVSPVIADFQD